MKFKLQGNDILSADFIFPDVQYATFADGLTRHARAEFIATLNHGGEMMQIYRDHRENLNIRNAGEMLTLMERAFCKFDDEIQTAKRWRE